MSEHVTRNGAPFDTASVPEAVVLKLDRRRLELAWCDGKTTQVSAQRLRAACRCAWCTRARIDGTFSVPFETIAIDRLAPVGDYAINIAFSDGHARGIYPWGYLHEIASADSRLATPIASRTATRARVGAGPFE